LRQLRALSELGVGLSLDDFGTGYSSLAYLQEYPFNEIKIDQTFVRRMLDDRYSRQIVTTIIGLARVLGAEVVAEGIEEPMMRDMLLDMGCHIGQGYFFSMPLVDEDFRWLLQQHPVLPLGLQHDGARS
jgi:EAL domain-containing protein (putative c-di-GMP-specific phosphodiesterase class I)